MDPALDAALRPILRDMRRTAGVRLRVVEYDETGAHGVWLRRDDGTGIYLTALDGHDPVDDLAQTSDAVHEEVVEALWRAERSTTWPSCPAHPGKHPLQVTVVDHVVVWVCPRAPQTPVHRVGRLPALP